MVVIRVLEQGFCQGFGGRGGTVHTRCWGKAKLKVRWHFEQERGVHGDWHNLDKYGNEINFNSIAIL